MFSLKTILFASLFTFCSIGAIFMPQLGVYGYLADYCIGPASQWWEAPLSGLGIRYSLTLALATSIGFLLHYKKQKFGTKFFQSQEIIIFLFLACVWFSFLIGDATIGRYTRVDHPTIKFTKIIIFIFLLTHIITEKKYLDYLIWVFTISSFLLGLKAWGMPRRAFVRGRLEGIGGADFSESNFLAAFMAAMLPLIGIQLLRSKNIYLKAACIISAAFTANTIVLCRSRGAFVGIAAGSIASMFLSPKEHRRIVALCLILGIMGGFYVSDAQYIERLTTIIVASDEVRDESANSRFKLWGAGIEMATDKPMGIGIGNWYQTIGKYIPEYRRKDSHNTYIKCLAELGFQGFFIFALFIFYTFYQLREIVLLTRYFDKEKAMNYKLLAFGLSISIIVYLFCAITITLIYTEITWILLMLPVCLRRCLENDYFDSQNNINSTNKA